MRRSFYIKLVSYIIVCMVMLTGCAGGYSREREQKISEREETGIQEIAESKETKEQELPANVLPDEITAEPDIWI